MNNIVFLVGSYVPHQLTSINGIIESTKHCVHSFSVSKNFKYLPEESDNLKLYKLSNFNKKTLLNKIESLNPIIVVAAGWMIPEYNWVCKQLRKQVDIPIVAQTDTPWYGTFRQRVNCLISPLHVRRAFSHIWVAGIRQYDYARKLGFANNQIVFNSLTADNAIFNRVSIEAKERSYPKNFLYIGRYTAVKGLDNLIKAWNAIEDKKGWTFTLIGAGEQKQQLEESRAFVVKDYMTQDLLLDEMQEAGCFVLPSLFEPWALVIHEAACAGLPIVCTETCGAAPHFVINNYNGYRVKDNSVEDLKNKLEKIINLNTLELLNFSHRSRELSVSINPQVQAANIGQLIYGK